MIEVRQACRPRTADRRRGFIGRLIKDSAATWRKKRALHWPVSLWTPAYSYLRHAPFLRNKTFFFTQRIFFLSPLPLMRTEKEKPEMSPLSLRYTEAAPRTPFYPISPSTCWKARRLSLVSILFPPFVNADLNWNFFTLSPPCVEMPHKIRYSSTAVLRVFFEEHSLIIVSDRRMNALSGFLCAL